MKKLLSAAIFFIPLLALVFFLLLRTGAPQAQLESLDTATSSSPLVNASLSGYLLSASDVVPDGLIALSEEYILLVPEEHALRLARSVEARYGEYAQEITVAPERLLARQDAIPEEFLANAHGVVAKSDSSGYFSLQNVPIGSYYVCIAEELADEDGKNYATWGRCSRYEVTPQAQTIQLQAQPFGGLIIE